jgi:glucan phosphoethanolaminetransferase (alkaline phosphatase superfamily)
LRLLHPSHATERQTQAAEMLINSLQAAILGIGAIISIICLTGVMLPAQLLHAVQAAWQYPAAMYVAVMVRLTIGVLLVLAASHSRFPLAFEILGWLAILAALLVPVAGRARIDRLLDWWSRRSTLCIRLWSLAGLAFGCFLVYGAS